MEYGNRIQEWWDVLKPKVLQAFTRLEIDEELIHIMDDTLFELGEAANNFKVIEIHRELRVKLVKFRYSINNIVEDL